MKWDAFLHLDKIVHTNLSYKVHFAVETWENILYFDIIAYQ